MKNIRQLLSTTLNADDYENFIRRQAKRYEHITSTTKQTHSKKLRKLRENKMEEHGLKYNTSWFVNNTDIPFSEESKWLLSLGSKFTLPIDRKNFSTVKLIADLEQWVQTMTDDREKDVIRTKIANRIMTHKRTNKNNLKDKFILSIYEDTKRFLKRYGREIVVTKSDKGNKTVVMYREQYKSGMEELLNDKTTYKRIRTDPTCKLQRANNTIITNLFKQNYISKTEKY